MSTTKGVVEVVANRSGYYNVKLNDGNWYGFGKQAPSVSKGDFISFEWEANGNFRNAKVATVKAAASAPSTVPAQEAFAAAKPDWDAKDKRIAYMSCRNTAVDIHKLLIDTDALKLPAKQADKYDALQLSVFNMAEELFIQLYGQPFTDGVEISNNNNTQETSYSDE